MLYQVSIYDETRTHAVFNDRVEQKTEWQQQPRAECPDETLPFSSMFRKKTVCLFEQSEFLIATCKKKKTDSLCVWMFD